MMEELIARVFCTRNAAHLEHWRTKSYAQHVALCDFYKGIINALDEVVEAHQGVFSLVRVGELPAQPKVQNIVDHLEDDLVFIQKHRAKITGGIAAIDNLLQGLEGVYMTALYKLKNLS